MNNPTNFIDLVGLECYAYDGSGNCTSWGGGGDGFGSFGSCGDWMTDASCSGGPVGPGSDFAGSGANTASNANSFFNQSITQNLIQSENLYDCSRTSSCPSDMAAASIVVYAYGVWGGNGWTSLAFLPPPEAVAGSQPYMIGDTPIYMNFISCSDGCGQIWQNAQSFVGAAWGSSVLVGAAPAAYGTAVNLSIYGYASAETLGVPATAATAWTLSNSRTIQNWIKIGGWIWNNW